MSDCWSDPSPTSILHVCEQRRLWQTASWMRRLAYVIRTIILWAGSFYFIGNCIKVSFIQLQLRIWPVFPLLIIRPKTNICVFQVSRPYLGFWPDPKHFIVNCEQNIVKFDGKWGKYRPMEKCNFYIKYFDKIKCYADRPYLVFSELKPETHIYLLFFVLPNYIFSLFHIV